MKSRTVLKPPSPRCPSCQSERTKLITESQLKCTKCGYVWVCCPNSECRSQKVQFIDVDQMSCLLCGKKFEPPQSLRNAGVLIKPVSSVEMEERRPGNRWYWFVRDVVVQMNRDGAYIPTLDDYRKTENPAATLKLWVEREIAEYINLDTLKGDLRKFHQRKKTLDDICSVNHSFELLKEYRGTATISYSGTKSERYARALADSLRSLLPQQISNPATTDTLPESVSYATVASRHGFKKDYIRKLAKKDCSYECRASQGSSGDNRLWNTSVRIRQSISLDVTFR